MLTPSQRLAGYFALAFLVGLGCGQFFHSETHESTTTPVQPNALTSNPAAERRTDGMTNVSDAEHPLADTSSAKTPIVDNALASSLLAATHTPDYFKRKHDLYDIAMSLDADGIAHAMEVTQSLPKYERDWAQPTLIARWLDFDPAAAFSWANALPRGEQRGEMLREFFHSLGLKNAAAALQYLNAFNAAPDHGRENYTYSVFEAWSTNDPAAAAQTALSLTQADARSSALSSSLGHWAEHDPLAALAWAQQLPSTDSRRTQRDNVLRVWAANDPQAALANAMALPQGTERNVAVSDVIRGAAQTDIESAKQMLTQLPEGAARTSAISSLISQYAYQHPEAFTDLVLTLPPSQQRNGAFQIGNNLARQDVAAALAWAAQLSSDEVRTSVTNSIVQTWAQTDPKAAAEYYLKNPPPDGQGYGFISAVSSWAREDSTAALAWARTLPDEKQREAALSSALGGMANRDPKQAASLAISDLSGNSQLNALSQIASTWASSDPRAAVAWATQLPDASRAPTLSSVTSTWARNDPRGVAQWLDQMPAGGARDGAVSSFVNSVSDDDPEGAVAWAATIGDTNQRNNVVQQAFWHWQRTNKAAAAAWLDQTTSISDSTRENLKRNLR